MRVRQIAPAVPVKVTSSLVIEAILSLSCFSSCEIFSSRVLIFSNSTCVRRKGRVTTLKTNPTLKTAHDAFKSDAGNGLPARQSEKEPGVEESVYGNG